MSTRTRSEASRARAKANADAVAAINDRAKPSRSDLIAEAQALGIEGAVQRMKTPDLLAAIDLRKALAVTPQIDAAEARQDAQAEPVPVASSKNGRARSDRAAATLARRKATNNHRGKGTAITDEELVLYVRRVREAFPESSIRTEQEYAYWVEGLSVSRGRWDKAWAAA